MDAQKIADRLVELYNAGKATDAERELYHEDVVSYEQDPAMEPVKGLAHVIAKTEAAFANVEKVNVNKAVAGIANHDSFLVIYNMDVVFKNGFHMKGTEYGFYKVKDDKVVEEYFFAHLQ